MVTQGIKMTNTILKTSKRSKSMAPKNAAKSRGAIKKEACPPIPKELRVDGNKAKSRP